VIPTNGSSIAIEVIGIRQAEPLPIVLVEGQTDSLLYRKFFLHETRYRLISCRGKENLLDAMRRLTSRGIAGVLAICDADYDALLGIRLPRSVLPTDHHDAEVMGWVVGMSDDCVRELIHLRSASEKVTHKSVVDEAVTICASIGNLRLENARHHWSLRFKAIEAGEYVKRRGFDREKYLDAILTASPESSASRSTVDAALKASGAHQPSEVMNGHDLASVVDALVAKASHKKRLGGATVEMLLRAGFYPALFNKTLLLQAIRIWEAENALDVLSDELAA
jgi:hypothetical protein